MASAEPSKVEKVVRGLKTAYRVASTDPPRTLRVASAVSGLLLVIGGITGVLNIFNPLNAVISLYNIMFGLLIIATELKGWPIIKTFQKRVDVYFHLLSSPRGKGGFYCFIGFLAFISTDWSVASFCVLCVGIVGVIHLFSCARCGARDVEAGAEAGVAASSEWAGPPAGLSEGSGWGDMLKQVISDSPEMLDAGVKLAANNPGMATTGLSMACGSSSSRAGDDASSGSLQPLSAGGAAGPSGMIN